MARTAKLLLLLMVGFLFIIGGCSDDEAPIPVAQVPAGGDEPQEPDNLFPRTWTRLTVEAVDPEFTYLGLKPGCLAAPLKDGGTTDEEYAFFVKGGDTNNLVVFFEGGGACWSKATCITAPTCFQEVTSSVERFNEFEQGIWTDEDGEAIDTETGIFLDSEDNPFAGWNFVYISYCTGDIHIGAQDTDYALLWDRDPRIVQHRGAVNFQLVLKYLIKNINNAPDKIFVTGSSAGSYGAMVHFPHIKAAFPESSMYVLGDAGCGESSSAFREETSILWNPQHPAEYISEFGYIDYSVMSWADIISIGASYYPNDRFVQYTTEADAIQAFFYGRGLDYDKLPLLPDWRWLDPLELQIFAQKFYDESDPELLDFWTGAWANNMKVNRKNIRKQNKNYKCYIGDGDRHTIMYSPEFYTEASADGLNGSVTGKPFLEWVNEMLDPDFNWNASTNYVAPE